MKKPILIIGIIMFLILIYNNKEDYVLIPNEAIRVRVIANSYEKKDIEIKEELKNLINNELQKILNNTVSIEDARNKINSNIDFINSFVDNSLKKLNYDNNFSINYGLNYFPEKTFKGVVYNSGLYESLVITLGNGNGPNYWCVLYPPLCIVEDNNKEEYEYKLFIKELLDKYI